MADKRVKRDQRGRFRPIDPAPCPWCGGETIIEHGWTHGGWAPTNWNGTHFVECQECGARGPTLASPLEARKEWEEVAVEVPGGSEGAG